MYVLALDLALKTGWAHSNGHSGVQDFRSRRGDSPGMRWIEFEAWLRRLLDAAPVEILVYEQAHHRGGAATHVAHSLIACVEKVASERGIEITNRHSASIKKHALPNSKKRNKAKMIQAAENKWPDMDIISDDHSDALWLLDLVQKELGK